MKVLLLIPTGSDAKFQLGLKNLIFSPLSGKAGFTKKFQCSMHSDKDKG